MTMHLFGFIKMMMSFVHYMCCTCKGAYCSFNEGYAYMQQELKAEYLKHLFQVIKSGATFEEVLEIAGQLCAFFDICSFIDFNIKYIEKVKKRQ